MHVPPVPVVLNARAGAALQVDAVRAAFDAHDIDVEVHACPDGGALAATLDRVLARHPPLVVAGGGDGTVATVAERLLDGDGTLGVLPLGTLNHFARDLGLPLALDAAAAVIARGAIRTIDVGQVDGHAFLNNASIGLYPRIVLARDAARRRLHLGKWPALGRAVWHALRAPRALAVTLRVDDRESRRRTPFLFVGNNRYTLRGLEAGTRRRLDGGVLSVHVLREQSPARFLWLALRTLCGRHSRERDFETFAVESFDVDAAGDAIEVACDGEVLRLPLPLRFRVRPRALRVLADAGAEESA